MKIKTTMIYRTQFCPGRKGVVVGVVIKDVKWYDLVKIKPTESEAEHRFCLWLRRSRSSENYIVGVGSRSGRINQWQCSTLGLAIGWFFRFCFRLRQSSFHWIISAGVVNAIGRNGSVLILLIPIPSRLWLRFSIFTSHKVSYDSDYDNQVFMIVQLPVLDICFWDSQNHAKNGESVP